eukprot:779718-Amphidinium_carterae.1
MGRINRARRHVLPPKELGRRSAEIVLSHQLCRTRCTKCLGCEGHEFNCSSPDVPTFPSPFD